MCGICGAFGDLPSAIESILNRQLDALEHRGPDDQGQWHDASAGVALGHRRLSIVDLSTQGHQPMRSKDDRWVMVFNGEIYNFQTLRSELEQTAGSIPWSGRSDTEVLLEAISHWGIQEALTRTVGMFAIALWDRRDQCLILARDRMGEKPLYFAANNGLLLFASELKALERFPDRRWDLDRDALGLFLRHSYIPAPHTIYKQARKLKPGTFVEVRRDARGEITTTEQVYWSLNQVAEAGLAHPYPGTEFDAIEDLKQLLGQAIQQQMVADVPLGAFLSGGVDSSTLVALMQVKADRRVKTFSIGFEESEYNEAHYAKAVAAHLGTDHTELYVTASQAREVIPKLAHIYDEPFADSSQIPTFLVAQLARQQVKVSLSGDGGDELFGGYHRYYWGQTIAKRVGFLPWSLRRWMAQGLRILSPKAWNRVYKLFAKALPKRYQFALPGDQWHKFSKVLAMRDLEHMYWALISHWDDPYAVVIHGAEPESLISNPAVWPRGQNFVERMMHLDCLSYLPDDILVKVDRAAMAVGLESRIPMLDHRVIEFAARLPVSYKLRQGQGKWILRRVLDQFVPPRLIERPKMGFGIPADKWLRGPLRDWAEDLLSESRLKREGVFHPGPIRLKWTEHLSGQRNWANELWDVLMFQAWYESRSAL